VANIKPITTHYNGYRFRSRTEARWAVFFDTLKIAYEYELEGYVVDGICYLPDFYLPTFDVFAEIKVNALSITPEELVKIFTFALGADKPTLLILGTPGNHKFLLVDRRHVAPLEELYDEITAEVVAETIAEMETDACVTIAPLPRGELSTKHLVYTQLQPYDDYGWSEAIKAAREARFEFAR
jgi:hypothetical protein